MNRYKIVIVLTALTLCAFVLGASAQQQTVPYPQPTVPEYFTAMGQYVRMAYNNEGFATLGYRTTQQSVGENWVLLDVGITVHNNAKEYTLKREHLTLKTPDGTIIPLASKEEFNKAGGVRNMVLRDNNNRDSIDYFPVQASKPCTIAFFTKPGAISYDQVELNENRGCVGRIFFQVPGGTKTGQYWLNIKFANSELQVPFRIMTKEEEKEFGKNWQELKKAHDAAFEQ